MIGVNFQPGLSDASNQGKPQGGTNTGAGVQEAIKVLSLRLPRVVGAQAVSPQALLNSQGGGGSRVDSVVNQVLAKYFPTAGTPSPAQNFGSMPTFDPNQGAQQAAFTSEIPYTSPFGGVKQYDQPAGRNMTPRVVVDLPPPGSLPEAPFVGTPKPNLPTIDGGWSPFPGMVEPFPKRSPFPMYPDFGGGSEPREPEPAV